MRVSESPVTSLFTDFAQHDLAVEDGPKFKSVDRLSVGVETEAHGLEWQHEKHDLLIGVIGVGLYAYKQRLRRRLTKLCGYDCHHQNRRSDGHSRCCGTASGAESTADEMASTTPTRDCRNMGLECGAGFECSLNNDGRYECLPSASQAGEPIQLTAGEAMTGGQTDVAGQAAGMAANGGEVFAGGQNGAAGQAAMAGVPAREACYGVRPIEVRSGNPMPGAIAAAFEVSSCANEPAPNLAEDHFALFENGGPIDAVEASRTILDRKAAAFVTIVLDNSPSVAAANAVDAVADAALTYVTTALTNTEQVYVSVATFSRRFTVLASFSNDLRALRTAIEAYRADGSGSNTTNLYGAYIEALTASTTAQADYRTRNRDGLVTFGEVLFLTDGNDNAGVSDLAEAQAALSITTDEVLVVGLGNVDANAVNALSTTDGVLAAADDLRAVFNARVTRILQRQQSIYVLGYCSPKLRGEHAVTVAIDGAPDVQLLNFNADGWLDYMGPECSRAAFIDGCTDSACGGLWCGSCGSPHHTGECALDLSCVCTDNHFAPNLCATCNNFWSGEDCTVCDERFTGVQCDQCAGNFAGENCAECANFWSGEDCTVCSDRFTGAQCDKCVGNFVGENCQDCANFWSGVDCTVCRGRFTGAQCDQCAGNFAGENCQDCANFWSGPNCNVCGERFTGPRCDRCSGNFAGENCAECANFWSGEDCTVCGERFTGARCDQCSKNFAGENCQSARQVSEMTVTSARRD